LLGAIGTTPLGTWRIEAALLIKDWSSGDNDVNLESILVLFIAELEYSEFEHSCSELCQYATYIESFKFTFVMQKVRVSVKPLEINLRGQISDVMCTMF
jgi:hypothetical protein